MKEAPFTIQLNILIFPNGKFELLFNCIYYCVFISNFVVKSPHLSSNIDFEIHSFVCTWTAFAFEKKQIL